MIIPEGFGQVNWMFSGSNLPNGAQCTLGIEMPVPTPTPAEAANAAIDWWTDNITAFQVDEVTLVGVLVKYGPNETGVSDEVTTVAAGQDSGEPEAPQISALIRKNTVDGGHAGRGRLYMPGLRDSRVQVGGTLVGTFRDDLQGAWDQFLVDLEDADYRAVVLHGESSPLEEPSRITSFLVDARCATQRRRNR